MHDDPLIREMDAAVQRSPEVIELRLHLVELLLSRGDHADALSHAAAILAQDPANTDAVALVQRCTAALATPAGPAPAAAAAAPSAANGFDWSAAEQQVADIAEPAFVEQAPDPVGEDDYDVISHAGTRLADVAGMDAVKAQLELALLGPMRNPELAKAFSVSARGGLLLYGPPGCGKTFIAKAVAGELGANFYPVGIADVVHRWFGESERAIRNVFDTARRNAPCVLFFDEIDALGHRRSGVSGASTLRVMVNTLLEEMDSATSVNDGVFVLGATNSPWDVDPALRRPGRFDRMIFVGLPDRAARAAIVKLNLVDKPVAGIDLAAIAARTENMSGADVTYVCTTATQLAMAESMRSGQIRPITMTDINNAIDTTRPSAGPWLETARNVVEFANGDGTYDELARYLRTRKIR
ncbi:ATP-binding protein (plasmid) [Mycolicibacterium psychrotolerans]|uniref:ATP-binding protein n=1 Tax=Mycolicibacterium psychrotolerans TaxID=216929 RepID=UPI003D6698E8